jgi:hypothetical protein
MLASGGIWLLFVALPSWYPDEEVAIAAGERAPSMPSDGETVEATLFYVSDDGMRLVGIKQPLEQQPETAAQARVIIEAQLTDPPQPLLSPIPTGTELRAFYLTNRGEAFVDLSEEVTLNHSGGSLEELFTVYAVVNAVTANLSSINAVQILVNGQEVDTLAGHVDLQRPLELNMRWVADPEEGTISDVPSPEPTP